MDPILRYISIDLNETSLKNINIIGDYPPTPTPVFRKTISKFHKNKMVQNIQKTL